ncbi:MAG TPA: hypothetical protein VLG13_00430 [Patescibacteria group bacterium]|nr:hypothetical protein [Patescibacteria group bacterium]
MALEQGVNFTGLEIYRPVTDGAGKFLNKLRFRGANALGDDQTTADIDIYREQDALENGDEGYVPDSEHRVMRQIGNPRVKPSNLDELHLGLYAAYIAPRSARDSSRVYEVAEELLPGPYVPYRAIRQEPRQGVKLDLLRAGLNHDIPKQDKLDIWFDRLSTRTHPFSGRKELVLQPAEDQPVVKMLHSQVSICRNGVHNYRKLRKLIIWEGNGLSVAVGTLMDDVTPSEEKKLEERMSDQLPLKLALGGIERIVTQKSSVHWD